jgi:hypothetical protein
MCRRGSENRACRAILDRQAFGSAIDIIETGRPSAFTRISAEGSTPTTVISGGNLSRNCRVKIPVPLPTSNTAPLFGGSARMAAVREASRESG